MSRLPLPGDKMQGKTVIASCWLNDDNLDDLLALLMVLNNQSPYYTVGQIESLNKGLWQWIDPDSFMNINEAVEAFAQSGGDI